MDDQSTGRRWDFVDRADWGEALLCGVFLVIFPIAIFAMWNEPREAAPLVFIVPLTLVFALVAPFLLRQIAKARSRYITLHPSERILRLTERRPFAVGKVRDIALDGVHSVRFETTDNDGYWYRAAIDLGSDEHLVFAQGNYHASVYAEAQRMIEALRQMRPKLEPEVEIMEVRG